MLRVSPNRLLVTALLLWGSLVVPAGAHPTGYEGYTVVRIQVSGITDLAALGELLSDPADFELWSEALGLGSMEVRVSPAGMPLLDAAGLRYEVVLADLQQYIDKLYGLHDERRDETFFANLRTYDEHVQFMQDLVASHPGLAQMISLGDSVDGRPLWAMRITGPAGDKPGVMYHGAEHGNEQATASVVAYAADYLLTNYGSDTQATALVDDVEWFLLPIMNPDGYENYERFNAHGVDLNRNWGGPGSGEDPNGGPYPFSEPETQEMRDFYVSHPNVRMHIDFHGYARWLMWPWNHTPLLCPDHRTFRRLCESAYNRLAAVGGGHYRLGSAYNVSYAVSGGSMGYVYGELGIWSFTFELRDLPVPTICEHFLPTMLYLSGWINDCNDNGIPDAVDLADGTSFDTNGDHVPDECECIADIDNSGSVGIADLLAQLSHYGTPDGAGFEEGDLDRDWDVDLSDLASLLAVYGNVCPPAQ